MNKTRFVESDYEFRILTTNLSDMLEKTYFTTELTLLKCTSGSAVISINSRKCVLKANHNFLLMESMVFRVLEISDDFSAISYLVSLPFYYELSANMDPNIFGVLRYGTPDLYNEEDLKTADLLLRNLFLIYENKERSNRRIMVMNIIVCYIYEMYELTLPFKNIQEASDKNKHYNYIINAFYNLVFENAEKYRNIEFYADKLNMSSRYLFKIVQTNLHITPKQLIDDVVISLLKQQLLSSKLNKQEIANKYYFPDQSSFGQYFKRCTGMSPSAFQNKHG